MNPTRIWTLGAVAATIAVLGGAIGLGVQPQLAAAAAADDSAKQVQAVNDVSQIELARLSRLAAKQADLEEQDAKVALAVPRTLKLNTFTRQLRETAAADGVDITALTLLEPTAYLSPVATASTAATPAATSATPAPAASPTPAATPAVDPGLFGRTDPRITAANFVVVPVTVIVTGDEAAGLAFARDVQRMDRLFAVSTVTFAKGTDAGGESTTTVSGSIYSLHR